MKFNKKKKGFTLIELLVTITIMTIMMSVVLINNAQFNNSIILTNAAYEVALAVRQAQVYGLSSRQASTVLNQGYAVYVSSIETNNENKKIILFANTCEDTSTSYEGPGSGSSDDCTDQILTGGVELGRGIFVQDVCYPSNNKMKCYNGNSGNHTKASAVIKFKRPNPEASIVWKDNGSDSQNNPSFVQINMNTPGSTVGLRCVRIYLSGQVSIKSGNDGSGQPLCKSNNDPL